MTSFSRILRGFMLCAASASFLAACGGDDDFDDRTGLADPQVRFVHAIPSGPAVTLQRGTDNEPAATNVGYRYGSQYYGVDTSFTSFTLRQANNNNQLATVGFEPQRGHKYTLVALPQNSGAELMVIDDPYNKSLTSDDAHVRVLNAAPNAQTFDVYLTSANADLATASPRFTALAYKDVEPKSGNDSADMEGDNYRLRIAPAGSKTVIFDAMVDVPKNGDWLLVVLPADASPTTTNAVQVLLVRADESVDATDDLIMQP